MPPAKIKLAAIVKRFIFVFSFQRDLEFRFRLSRANREQPSGAGARIVHPHSLLLFPSGKTGDRISSACLGNRSEIPQGSKTFPRVSGSRNAATAMVP